jgi:hypothetical protein
MCFMNHLGAKIPLKPLRFNWIPASLTRSIACREFCANSLILKKREKQKYAGAPRISAFGNVGDSADGSSIRLRPIRPAVGRGLFATNPDVRPTLANAAPG